MVASSDFPSFAQDKHNSIQYGELAQLGERLVCNQEVTGSSPVFSTKFGANLVVWSSGGLVIRDQ